MALQSLTPPQDITWKRMAYSRDMIAEFDINLPPKWRSSLAVYYYIMPEEETADAYPDSKIVYLKLTCSITGWNPSEELMAEKKIAKDSVAFDDVQKSVWEAIESKGWSSVYWPCLGAIMQVAVYPSKDERVGPDDYPYIMDFEPKKRELYESVTETGESLSGTTSNVAVTNGTTGVKETEWGGEVSVKARGGILGWGVEGKASAYYKDKNSDTTVWQNTTDTSREARETLSRTVAFSQMYQLFNGYHLGTNRALFVVAPRPHTVANGAQTEFNLINGARKLEGIQEVFLVVHLPSKLSGFCVQASLDTGHTVYSTATNPMQLFMLDGAGGTNPNYPSDTDNGDDDDDTTSPENDTTLPGIPTIVQQLVVTRRIVQNCGKFDANGNFTLTGGGLETPEVGGEVPVPPKSYPVPPKVVFEGLVKEGMSFSASQKSKMLVGNETNSRIALANQMNIVQNNVIKSMVSGISAGNYEPRPFTNTNTFLRMTGLSLNRTNMDLAELEKMQYLNKRDIALLTKSKITTIAELFQIDNKKAIEPDLKKIRAKILKKALLK